MFALNINNNNMTNSTTIKNLRAYIIISSFMIISISAFSQVGINTTEPMTTVDVNGAISLRESPELLEVREGHNIDVPLGSFKGSVYSQYFIKHPSETFLIDGIRVQEGADGQIVRLVNITEHDMVIIHKPNGNSFKIVCPGETDLVLSGRNSSVTLKYSKMLQKWTVIGYAADPKTPELASGKGLTDISRQNSSWATMDGAEVTFTPKKSTVYIVFEVFGSLNGGNADVRLVKDGVVISGTQMRADKSGGTYKASLFMFPVAVTPGQQTNIRAQWYRDGFSWHEIENNPASNSSHRRYITVME